MTVEMEAAALFAVAEFRRVQIAQLLYGDDDVSGIEWDPREFGRNISARETLFWLSVEACLVMEDGSTLIDSKVIVEYLDTLTPVCKLLPAGGNGRERADIKNWEALADGILDAGVLVRLERTQRPPEQHRAAWIARQLDKITLGLAALEARLGESAY